MSTSSKQVFIEYFRWNILCSPGRHIVSYCICWSCDYVSCDCQATDTGEDYWSEADCRFYRGAREWDERVKTMISWKQLICTQFIKDNLDVSKVFITSLLNSGRFSKSWTILFIMAFTLLTFREWLLGACPAKNCSKKVSVWACSLLSLAVYKYRIEQSMASTRYFEQGKN